MKFTLSELQNLHLILARGTFNGLEEAQVAVALSNKLRAEGEALIAKQAKKTKKEVGVA